MFVRRKSAQTPAEHVDAKHQQSISCPIRKATWPCTAPSIPAGRKPAKTQTPNLSYCSRRDTRKQTCKQTCGQALCREGNTNKEPSTIVRAIRNIPEFCGNDACFIGFGWKQPCVPPGRSAQRRMCIRSLVRRRVNASTPVTHYGSFRILPAIDGTRLRGIAWRDEPSCRRPTPLAPLPRGEKGRSSLPRLKSHAARPYRNWNE